MALSSGLSRLCNTKANYTGVTSGSPLPPDPPHALQLNRRNDPHGAGTPEAARLFLLIRRPRESWLRPHRDQLPGLHTSPGSNTF